MYSEGDRVVITDHYWRPDTDSFRVDGWYKTPSDLEITTEMVAYVGRTAVITIVDEDQTYMIDIDGGSWYWDKYCFEPANKYDEFDFDDLEKLL